jgi:hypothetical protein
MTTKRRTAPEYDVLVPDVYVPQALRDRDSHPGERSEFNRAVLRFAAAYDIHSHVVLEQLGLCQWTVRERLSARARDY